MKTSIVICACKEEETISRVVETFCKYNPVTEVILAEDGSFGNIFETRENLQKRFSFKVIRFNKIKGES